jgi:hypothetical protein
MAVRLSALRAGSPLPPGIFVVLISVRGWFDPRAIRITLRQLKNAMTLSGIEPATFPTCGIVPQPTTLPRALQAAWPGTIICVLNLFWVFVETVLVSFKRVKKLDRYPNFRNVMLFSGRHSYLLCFHWTGARAIYIFQLLERCLYNLE